MLEVQEPTALKGHRQPCGGPGLPANVNPRALTQKKSLDSLIWRQPKTSSKTSSASTSPSLPAGFASRSGSLRVPGGPMPLQAHSGPSPFRFLAEDEESPMTPMDVSPITPRTPRFSVLRHTPVIAPSSPASSRDDEAIDYHVNGKVSIALGRTEPTISADGMPSDEEEYVRYIRAEYARLAQRGDSPPQPTSQAHSRQTSQSTMHSRQTSGGQANSTTKNITKSPRPSIDMPLRKTNGTDSLDRKASTTSKSSSRLPYHDFAAAKRALEDERAGITRTQWATYKKAPHSETVYPNPKLTVAPSVQPVASEKVRVTPTPVKPALSRLGSRLKSEVKGAFARKPDALVAEGKQEKASAVQEEDFEVVQDMHWTELEC